MDLKETIHFIGPVTSFRHAKLAPSYRSLWDCVKAHIRYISRSSEAALVEGLDLDTWEKRVVATKGKQAAALKLVMALPNDLTPEEAVQLVQDFWTQTPLFLKRWQRKGVKYQERVALPEDHLGLVIHDSYGLSGHKNLHAHILVWPRDSEGKTLSLDRTSLKDLHRLWDEALIGKGYQIRWDPPDISIRFDPRKLRWDSEAQEGYRKWLDFRLLQDVEINEVRVRNMMKRLPDEVIERVKALDPQKVAAMLGVPLKKEGKGFRGHAIWRGDQTPSLRLYQVQGHWLWYDHGTGEGGSLIDLVMKIKKVSFRDAVKWLLDSFPSADPDPLPSTEEPEEEEKAPGIEILKTYDRPTEAIQRLLVQHRGLRWEDLERFGAKVVQIKFPSGKQATKVGFPNRSGGWELKDIKPGGPSFTISPKDISVAQGSGDCDTLLVAESIFDALAADQLLGKGSRTLVAANGVGQLERVLGYIQENRPQKAVLALDRDPSGVKAQEELKKALEGQGIAVELLDFGPFKDPSEALVAHRQKRASRRRSAAPGRSL